MKAPQKQQDSLIGYVSLSKLVSEKICLARFVKWSMRHLGIYQTV
jgi:hypothetical protein